MANQEQLEILKSGVENWNRWREENPNIEIDLANVSLPEAKLIGANLRYAILYQANLARAELAYSNLQDAFLEGANLEEVDLQETNLSNSILKKTNLNNADLWRAILYKTDLTEANLVGADLWEAHLRESDLTRADLTNTLNVATIFQETVLTSTKFTHAQFGNTVFAGVELTSAIDLITCSHSMNSYIDYHTLIKSKYLPLNFLRGCGLSDTYIKGLPSLIEQKEQFYNCFISYSSEDHLFANKLYNDLQNSGIRVWFAPEDMKIADKIRPALHKAIERHEKLLIILSKDSIKSPWVEDEVEKAFEQERKKKENVLFPIRVDDTIFDSDAGWADSIKNTRHIGDFTKWKDHDEYKKNFDKLVESLRVEAEG